VELVLQVDLMVPLLEVLRQVETMMIRQVEEEVDLEAMEEVEEMWVPLEEVEEEEVDLEGMEKVEYLVEEKVELVLQVDLMVLLLEVLRQVETIIFHQVEEEVDLE